MITFLLSIAFLILGFVFYGKFIERFFGANDSMVTPAVSKRDGVDFSPLPTWKIFTIQFLNIAGLGPVFGAILGAKYIFGLCLVVCLWELFTIIFQVC